MAEGKERSKASTIWAARCLFMHADLADFWLMGLGFIGAVGDGLSLPISIVVFYKMVNALGAGPSSPDFKHGVNQSSLHFLYVAAGSFLFAFMEGYCWTRTGERQARRMRGRYLKAVLRQEVGYFDLKKDGSTAEVVNCVSNDSFVIQDLLGEKVPNFIMNTATFVSSYIISFLLLWRLTLIAFPTVLLLIIPGLIYGRVLLTLARQIQAQYNKAGLIAEQAISSIRTVYSCAGETPTITSFSSALNSSARLGVRQSLAKGLALGSNGVTFSIWALMAWYGGRLVILHDVKGGSIFAAGSSVIIGGLALGLGLSNVKYLGEGIAAAERIQKVMDRKPAIDSESDEGEEVREVRGEVEFKKVRFCYPARPEIEVFRGFSLRVEAGKTAALVGASGSGKSTAVALLQRFYDPAGGGIEVDGVDIRRLKVKWLRGIMGMVSQEPLLFDMSIKENVLFGKKEEEGSLEEVVEAAKKANAHSFISQLPLGYDTQVGERGVQLSGGQKQRIAIARALIRQPKILLLDEATSALDSESERLVQEALDAAAVGRTTIAIAHRLSTIRNAHCIAFVDSGEVVETGSHEELIADPNSHYSALIRTQHCQPAEDHESLGSRSMSRRFSISSSTKSYGETDEPNQGNDKTGRSPSRSVPSLRRLLMMNSPEWRQALLGGTGAVLFGAVQPVYSYILTSMLMVYFIKDHEEMKEKIRTYALIFVGLSVVSFVVNLVQHYNLGVMGECLTKRVRERMLTKILTFEVGWFDQEDNSSGAVCSRLAKDAGVVRSLVGDRMSLIIQALTAVTVALTMGLIIAWRLALLIIATQPVIIACFYARRVLLKNISGKSIKSQSESSKLAAEAVANLRTITSFSSQSRILRLFDLAQSTPSRYSLRQSYLAGLGLALSQSLNICTWALDFWYGGILVQQGLISSKALLQTYVIVVSTGRVIADAGSTTSDLAKGSHSVASVFSILDRFSAIEPDDPDAYHPDSLSGSIEFRGVDFAYPSRPDVPILQRFSLAIQAGKSTALVGPSGSGKSTIISLIERFYDATAGIIRVDGRDIRSYNLRSLRRQIALVGQEPVMFAGTIRENITYGLDEAAESEAEAATRVANAHEFISGLKDGYETWCGERGLQLSGGQKQRIAIARAVLRDPKILLLDEATSALDGKSEKAVLEALERVIVGRTSVVVAHRLGTVRNCDLIAVMDKGRLVEKGSHAALMGKGETGMYCGLVRLQEGVERRVKA